MWNDAQTSGNVTGWHEERQLLFAAVGAVIRMQSCISETKHAGPYIRLPHSPGGT